MAVIFHILKKDLRASWILLCAMGAFLVLQVLQLWDGFSLEYSSGRPRFSPEIFTLVLYLIIMTIVVRVIQEDSLVGTAAFWLTRPIARKSLLLAKGLYTFLFLVLVPVAANFVLLCHFGMKPGQILPFLLLTFSIHLTIVCIFAALAVVTQNWVSFAISGVVALVCLFIANNWFEIPDGPAGQVAGFRILGWLLLAVTLCTIVYQYRTRQTRRSVIFLILGCVLAWTSCHFCFYHYVFRNPTSDIALSIQIGSVTHPNRGVYSPVALSYRPIFSSIKVQNIPVGEEAVLTRLDGKLEFANGEKITQHDGINPSNYGVNDALRSLLPGLEWGQRGDFNFKFVGLLTVRQDTYENLKVQSGTHSGKAQFEIYRDVLLRKFP
jgi:hypothetical protein